MNVYMYQADLHCEACGVNIMRRLLTDPLSPKNPEDYEDETLYDSDEYPKGPYPDGGGAADTPQHCGCGGSCFNAIEVDYGHKVGCLLENPLTADGQLYVADQHKNRPSCITELWCDFYGISINVNSEEDS